MAEFVPGTYAEATTYTPSAASLVVTFTNGVDPTLTDTVALDPEWACFLIKTIRDSDRSLIELHGCVPANSTQVKAKGAGFLKKQRSMAVSSFGRWLKHKP